MIELKKEIERIRALLVTHGVEQRDQY